MQWVASNWIWIAAIAAIFAVHRFGHGGHRHGSGYGSGGHAHSPRGSDLDWSNDRLGESKPSSVADRPGLDHVGHGLGESSDVPAVSGAAAHAGHDHQPASDGRRRHRHGC